MKRTTAEWVNKAEIDYVAASVLRRSRKKERFEPICFHSQQCAEKYLKARLAEAAIPFPRTHVLPVLLHLLHREEPLWLGLEPRLDRLSKFGVRIRYPGGAADADDAKEAFKICEQFRTLARQALGARS